MLFVGLLDRIFFEYLLMYNNDDDVIIFFKLNLCVICKISMVLLIYMDCWRKFKYFIDKFVII